MKMNEHGGATRRRFLAGGGALALGGAGLLAPSIAEASAEALPPVAKGKTLYWVTANLSDPFYIDGIAGMKKFSSVFGVKTKIVGPQDSNVAKMAKAFQTTLALPDTAGIFSYFYADFNAAKSLYEGAAKKGIPIVNGAGDWGPPRISFVGVRDEDAPTVAARYIGKALKGTGSVGHVGNTGVNIVREEKIFRQVLAKEFPKIKYAGNATHDASAADALKQSQAFLTKNPTLSAFWFGDGLGPSIADPLAAAAGKTQIYLRGFGANGLKAIANGKIAATFDRNTFDEEFYGFQMLYWWLAGYRVPDTVVVPTITVDKANVAAFMKSPYRRA
jgi:ABC-type sugar transport system substrate-binding protein